MAKSCSVCSHPALPEIDRALLSGVSLRALAARHGLSSSALFRHTRHLADRLAQESRVEDLAHLQALLEKLDLLEARLERLFRTAEGFRSLHIALGCLREQVRVLTLQEKFRHCLSDQSSHGSVPV
ncbi:MAG: hypothetical protein WCD80_03120 [Desulfobaccales bacterium]